MQTVHVIGPEFRAPFHADDVDHARAESKGGISKIQMRRGRKIRNVVAVENAVRYQAVMLRKIFSRTGAIFFAIAFPGLSALPLQAAQDRSEEHTSELQ